MSVLDVQDLSVALGRAGAQVQALSGVDLRIEPGEVVGLVGESGGGKSMLARAILGLLPRPATVQGRVLFEGQDVLGVRGPALAAFRGAGAALCFQMPRRALSPTRRVGAQLVDRLTTHRGLRGQPATRAALALFETVGMRDPARRLQAYPHELSGGMCQRVMIALALACAPTLLLADEPTTGLDATLTGEILQLLRREATENGRAALIISHDLASIAAVCDRLVVLYAGTVVEEGPTVAVIGEPAHPYTRALLAAVPDVSGPPAVAIAGVMPVLSQAPRACPFHPRCALAQDQCRASRPGLAGAGDGRRSACFRWQDTASATPLVGPRPKPVSVLAATSATPTPPLLRVSGLEVVYRARFSRGGFRALRGVDLVASRGETLGIVGESGCGKSTLARAMLGLVRPSKGGVRFDGHDLHRLGGRQLRALRRRMQMVFQDPIDALNPRRTVAEAIADPLRPLDLPRREIDERVDQALAEVGLDTGLRARQPGQLSGGQAQRVGIARALAPAPDLVVFDEPTSALDVTVQAQILDLLRQLMAERQRAYVFISHDLATVRGICDRVAVLYLGQVVEEGPTETVFARPLHPYTRALLTSVPSLRGTRPAHPLRLGRALDETDVTFGCPLAPRCPHVAPACREQPQSLADYGDGQRAACWRIPEITRLDGDRARMTA